MDQIKIGKFRAVLLLYNANMFERNRAISYKVKQY